MLADQIAARGASVTDPRHGSWIIRNKETGAVVCELFEPRNVARINAVKYEAVPILEYLQSLNRSNEP